MSKSIKLNLSWENIYLFLFSLYAFFEVLNSSLLNVNFIMKILKIVCPLGLFLVYLCHRKIKLNKLIISMLILLVFSTAAYHTDRNYIFVRCLFLLCASATEFKKIVKVSLISSLVPLLIVILMSQIGYLPDYVFNHDGAAAHSLGFPYYSKAPYILLYCIIEYMYIKNNNLSWFKLILVLMINYVTYKITTLRLSFYLFMIAWILFVLLVKLNLADLRKGRKKYIVCSFYPLAFIVTVWSALHFNMQEKFWREMNALLSGRLELSNTAFKKYPITLFGQHIEMQGNQYHVINPNYFYIDSGFIYSLLGYGLIFTILTILIYSYLFKFSCEKNDKAMFIWLVTIMIFTIINNTWVNVTYNPLLLYFMIVFRQNKIPLIQQISEYIAKINPVNRKRLQIRG